jgi:OmpA-OmpF porin, OOP family
MNRVMLMSAAALLSLFVSVGCATKNYVRNQTTPVINKVNELDDLTAKNTNAIKDVDARAQQGIQQVNAKADTADQKAQAASQTADQANQTATNASHGVTSLANTVENLDNYHPVAEAQVHFGFDKADLTKKSKGEIDQLGSQIASAKHYIVVVDGNTDSVGDAQYNYQLSQRRAEAVIQYLSAKYDLPAYKIFVIGLGKDKPAASNKNSTGRAENRRVDVRVMTNSNEPPTSALFTQPAGQ